MYPIFSMEKTIREDGSQSVILVDQGYRIVEPVALFLEYLEKRGRALNTTESYCRGLKEYFTWLSKENLSFYEVTRHDMLSWMEFIKTDAGRKEEKSARTINKYLAIVASFYSFFEGIGGYIEENPIKKVNNNKSSYYQRFKVSQNQISVNFFRQKETKRKNTQRLFQNEINKLYKVIEQLTKDKSLIIRNQLLFRVLYETGCRISEVLGLRIKDFSKPNPTDDIGTIYIRRHFPLYHNDHSIKTNERDIPVSMDLIYEIDEYRATKVEDTLKTKYIPDNIIRQIENALKDEKNEMLKSLIEIGIDTGIRLSEALDLSKGCLTEDFTGRPVLYVVSKKIIRKDLYQ